MASSLRDWLPGVIQSLTPWLSSYDIPKGERWLPTIERTMQEVDVAILCLTPENIRSPWLLFEAGSFSNWSSAPRIFIYALGISLKSLIGPLSQFQIIAADKSGSYFLLQCLNSLEPHNKLREDVLENIFEANWPWLQRSLNALTIESSSQSDISLTVDEKLDEILKLLRIQTTSHPEVLSDESFPIDNSAISKPTVFIGSSVEGLAIAEAIQLGLDIVAECTIWNQSVFPPSKTIIEGLVDVSRSFECAVLILTPDDMLIKRGTESDVPRDNLIFEAGLFTGALGRARTFLIYSRDAEVSLPSDLDGVTKVTFGERQDGNLHAALGPVCTQIKRALGLA